MAWEPFVYQYGVMLVVFGAGIALAWRNGEVSLGGGRRRRNLLLLLGGMAYFMAMQGYLQFVSPAVHGDHPAGDRFFVRYFSPLGPPAERDGLWKLPVRVEGAWFSHDGRLHEVSQYAISQELDSGPPGNRFTKVCPVFQAPLTDWHPETLTRFEEAGCRFSEVTRHECLPACNRFDPENLELCLERCVKECKGQSLRLFNGCVE